MDSKVVISSVSVPFSHSPIPPFPHSPVGWNDWLEQWVAYSNWNYSLTFELTSQQVSGRTLYLRCGGLDTVANIRWEGGEGVSEGVCVNS